MTTRVKTTPPNQFWTPAPKIAAVATAVPEHVLDQDLAEQLAGALFKTKIPDIERLLPVFENTGISRRHLAKPVEWHEDRHTFAEVNAVHEQVCVELAAEAAAKAIGRAGIEPAGISAVIFVCSTGLATPTIDAKLIQALGLDPATARLPIFGLGCAGGVSGLARAAELARVKDGRAVLMVAVELCSLTFQRDDLSKSNLVATSLFGDGAAAVVIHPEGRGPALVGCHSHLFSDSADIMGWDLVESGFKVRFARSIPALVLEHIGGLVDAALAKYGRDRPDLAHYVVHPGGAKVLAAYAEGLNLPPDQFDLAREILRDYGNMSSPSVLFVLERFLENHPPSSRLGTMLALGPGFSAEQVLFRW